MMDKVKIPVILSVIRNRENPLDVEYTSKFSRESGCNFSNRKI
jgi:hypothetical protein